MIVLSLAQSFQILILISPGRIVSLVFTGALQRRLYHGKENNRMELLKDDRYWEVRFCNTKSSLTGGLICFGSCFASSTRFMQSPPQLIFSYLEVKLRIHSSFPRLQPLTQPRHLSCKFPIILSLL